MHVFKPKRMKNGKRWTSQFWSGRYRLEGDLAWTTVPLRVRQKEVAERKLAEVVNREERKRQGMLTDEVEASAAGRPLAEHLREYERDLMARNRAPGYIRKVMPRCRRVIEECRWARLGDITADGFVSWRASAGCGPRTANHYLDAVRSFLEWLVRCGRLSTNPLLRVQKAETRGHERVVRRAYTLDELRRLLAAAEARRPIYLGAALTGLRFGELGRLCCGDVELAGGQPMARLPASIQKTPEYKALPLATEVAQAWKPLVEGRPSNARLFAKGMPSHEVFNADLKRAGISKRDERGRTVDFHSFRKTFTTFLQVAGVDRRVVMEVARHRDSRLTDFVYTDVERLDLRTAVNRLPVLGPDQEDAQQDAHEPVPGRHQTASTGTKPAGPVGIKNGPSEWQKGPLEAEGGLVGAGVDECRRGDSNPHSVSRSGF